MYTGQIQIAAILSCIVFYLVALCFYWGVLPVVLPIADRKAYSEQDRQQRQEQEHGLRKIAHSGKRRNQCHISGNPQDAPFLYLSVHEISRYIF